MAMPQRDDPPSRCALRRTGTIEASKRQAAEKKAEARARAASRRKQRRERGAALPADQQEPARQEWEKVLRPFKRREPWL